jgi:hypothetical protein
MVGKRKDHDFTVNARVLLQSEDMAVTYVDNSFAPGDIALTSGQFVALDYSFTTADISEQG